MKSKTGKNGRNCRWTVELLADVPEKIKATLNSRKANPVLWFKKTIHPVNWIQLSRMKQNVTWQHSLKFMKYMKNIQENSKQRDCSKIWYWVSHIRIGFFSFDPTITHQIAMEFQLSITRKLQANSFWRYVKSFSSMKVLNFIFTNSKIILVNVPCRFWTIKSNL